jgi:hypothetical protein
MDKFDQLAYSEIEAEVDQCTFHTLWLLAPPRQVSIERLESLSAEIIRQLSLDGFRAESLGIKVMPNPDGEESLGVSIWFTANPLMSAKVRFND